MNKKILVWLGFVVSLVVACSGNTVSPPSRSAAPALFVHTPPAHVTSPLVGTYTTTITEQDGIFMVIAPAMTTKGNEGTVALGTWLIEFDSDGYYTALGNNSSTSEQYVGLGQYTVTANQLMVSDAKCWEFNGPKARTAMYSWTLEGRMLKLKVVGGDLCPAGKLLFTSHPLVKQA